MRSSVGRSRSADPDLITMEQRKESERRSKRRRLATAGEEKVKAGNSTATSHEIQEKAVDLIEPDSLLILSDGADSPILTHAMWFLTHEEVAKCEQTCKLLRKQASFIWKEMDECIKSWFDEDIRPKKVNDAKKRVLMHHIASELAITALLPEFSVKDSERSILDEDWKDRDYELYVQLSSDEDVFARGFFDYDFSEGLLMLEQAFVGVDFEEWQELYEAVESLHGLHLSDGAFLGKDIFDALSKCMKELTVTLVLVHKDTLKGRVVLSENNFFHDEPDSESRSREDYCFDHIEDLYKALYKDNPLDLQSCYQMRWFSNRSEYKHGKDTCCSVDICCHTNSSAEVRCTDLHVNLLFAD